MRLAVRAASGFTSNYSVIAKVTTVKGAWTGYFSSDLNRLIVAVRRQGSQNAELRIFATQ
jgi:hypothetical protein